MPLHTAVMAKLLVENRAEVNVVDGVVTNSMHCTQRVQTPLHMAVDAEAFDIVKLLVEHGADVNDVEEVSSLKRVLFRP